MLKQGLAKAMFSETYQKIPWLPLKENVKEHQWPFLDVLLGKKQLSYLDYVLAHRLFRDVCDASQEAALFVCHLIMAAKEGHLCVRINEDGITPSIEQIWKNDDGHQIESEEEQIMTQMLLRGVNHLPEAIKTTIDEDCNVNCQTPICRKGNDYYLQKYWIFETSFLKYLKKHVNTFPLLVFNPEILEKKIQRMCQEKILLEEQAEAIKQGCLNALTLITGGPGTGKTYTAGHLIRVFLENLSLEQRQLCQVVLAAPTGKAAANLQRSLSRVSASLEFFPTIQAKTLHSLLGMKQGSSYQDVQPLSADLVVIDESSMIDIQMMSRLFESLKPGSRLILLGDRHQLPSVEAGSVFFDLIQLQETHSYLNIPCVTLSHCLRAELKSLIDFALLVNKGLSQQVLNSLNDSKGGGIKRLRFPDGVKEAQRKLISHVLPYFPSMIEEGQPSGGLLDLFQSIRLLSPIRKGPFGVEALNELMWQRVSQTSWVSGWIAIPIMISMNDYRQELFNGETGVLIRRLPLHSIGSEDYALFPAREEGGQTRRLPALLLPKYDLAYCMSIHKSQGSEFDRVVLVLPEGSELFGREVFYTAITRARKNLEIYGSDVVILKTVEQQGIRLSGIEKRMSKEKWLKD